MRNDVSIVPYKAKPQMSAILFYASFYLSGCHFFVEIAVFYVYGFVAEAFLLLLEGQVAVYIYVIVPRFIGDGECSYRGRERNCSDDDIFQIKYPPLFARE